MKSIAEHMEVEYTDQLLDEIVDATEFETMKNSKRESEEWLRRARGDSAIYRMSQHLFLKRTKL